MYKCFGFPFSHTSKFLTIFLLFVYDMVLVVSVVFVSFGFPVISHNQYVSSAVIVINASSDKANIAQDIVILNLV